MVMQEKMVLNPIDYSRASRTTFCLVFVLSVMWALMLRG